MAHKHLERDVTTMSLVPILLLVKTIQAIDIKVNGEITFDLKISNIDLGDGFRWREEVGRENETYTMKSNGMTVGPVVECTFQYPEQEHIDAMLSSMMNQLTKVFTRVREYMNAANPRRLLLTRFEIVEKKDKIFFEKIYNNMTREYKDFYNNTSQRVDRTGRDPCSHQPEVEGLWRDLLEASYTSFRRACIQCVAGFIKEQSCNDPKLKRKLVRFLAGELAKTKWKQLDMLCDTFQLCYNELL